MELRLRRLVVAHVQTHSDSEWITPRVFLRECGVEKEFCIHMPGCDPQSLDIRLEGRTLVIRASLQRELELPGMCGVRRVRGYYARIELPPDVEPELTFNRALELLLVRAKRRQKTKRLTIAFV